MMHGIEHLPEAMYLAGEKQAELAELRKIEDEPFEGMPCDRCSELYGRVTPGCPGCAWMNQTQSKGVASGN
jgi:hypothetical protein